MAALLYMKNLKLRRVECPAWGHGKSGTWKSQDSTPCLSGFKAHDVPPLPGVSKVTEFQFLIKSFRSQRFAAVTRAIWHEPRLLVTSSWGFVHQPVCPPRPASSDDPVT